MTIEIKNKEDTLAELVNKKIVYNAETGVSTEIELDADDMAFFTKKAENRQAEHDAFFVDVLEKEKTNKASAKAKLIAGEALTEDEANTIVL